MYANTVDRNSCEILDYVLTKVENRKKDAKFTLDMKYPSASNIYVILLFYTLQIQHHYITGTRKSSSLCSQMS